MKKGIALLCALLLSTTALPQTTAFAAETDTAASGDLNADREFSIADVVLLQKKLLTVPDTVMADWQAGDLCADGKLDALDLGAMRQALTAAPPETPDIPDALEQLRGMDYETAVAKGYIARAEYNYQISGALKQTAEEALGRALDYSIDRFYLVSNDALGLDDSTRYLYHSGTGTVFPITEETRMNCATWYWKGSKAALYGIDDNEEVQNEFLDAMEFYGVTEIYYSSGANKLVNRADTVATFVRNAYARNMKVYLLTGEKTWLYEDTYDTAIYRVFDRVEEYNSMVDADARLAGVSYDVEVWTNSSFDWKNNSDSRKQQVRFIETAQQYADSKNLSVSYCLPFWIVRYDYTDDDGSTRNVYDAITSIATSTILMAYRDTPAAVEKLVAETQTNADNSALYYNEKNGCNLEIGVQADKSKEGDYVSFYEEELEKPGAVAAAIAQMQSDLAEHRFHTTYAIHQATALYEFYLSTK